MSWSLTPRRLEGSILSMKSSALILFLATAVAGNAQVGMIVPERFPLDRYSKLMNDAPFAVKTPDEKTEEVKIDWAEALYLGGASKFMENGSEKDWVYINHKNDPSAAFQLFGNEPNGQGIQIVKLDWHPENPAKTEVTLKKGTEFATLKRDQAAFAAPAMPPSQPGVMRPGQPGQPMRPPQPVSSAIPNANGAIRQPVVQPRAPTIPRPGSSAIPAPRPATLPQPAAVAPQGQGNQGAQGQGNDRRRIRVINSR